MSVFTALCLTQKSLRTKKNFNAILKLFCIWNIGETINNIQIALRAMGHSIYEDPTEH